MVEHQTLEREVRGWKPTSTMLCPEQDTLLPKTTGNTQEAVAPSRYNLKIVDWYVKLTKQYVIPI